MCLEIYCIDIVKKIHASVKIFFLRLAFNVLFLVFVAACRLSLAVGSEGYSLVAVRGVLIAVASLVAKHGL